MSDDIRIEENIILLKANMSSKKFIEDMKLRLDNNQNEEFSSKVDFELISSNEFIEEIRSVCLKSSKTNHRRASYSIWSLKCAIFLKSSLQSFLKQTVITFWQQKNRLDEKSCLQIDKTILWSFHKSKSRRGHKSITKIVKQISCLSTKHWARFYLWLWIKK